ncbi:hypothetical protein BaRGS_00005136 [Batillaria attramentaria]|uniref:Major facilitator superfamily (MFS) profile domain-containing protein n=1 Tax=Batillaria attramentaria TaxID=370345 RepID=A0ABD0LVQ2_9CAEN
MATNIDPTLRALGSKAKYQMLQLTVISLGAFGAGYQLLDNVFIGRTVSGEQCAPPSNNTVIPAGLQDVDWNSSRVEYGQCHIAVNRSDDRVQYYDCMFGYSYEYRWELSFRTEFDLVCDRSLLGGFVQSLVIMGQGVGAVTASFVSDRFGRKRVLVVSQIGLLVLGMGIGLSPSYAVLGTLKFLVGAFQQGVVTSMATMTTELFPTDTRRLTFPISTVMWSIASTSMALIAYLLRDYTWRYLQYTLSAVSFLFLIQLWYVDESLRWLVANGKKEGAIKVLKRAARVNKKDLNEVLETVQMSVTQNGAELEAFVPPTSADEMDPKLTTGHSPNGIGSVEKTLERQAEKLTLLDIFRHKRLLFNTLIVWVAWFTCAFSFFALIMMSSSLVGDRFLNYALIVIMESPPGLIFYFSVNRFGRKRTTQVFYMLTGVGLLASGIFRIFEDIPALAMMSVVMAMLGMVGASGMFGAIFFYTPELFPTNMRNQALGVASFAGRLGGMLSPFMNDLAEIVVWAPGVMIGTLSFLVVFLFQFLPETKGTELPQTVADIKAWYKPKDVEILYEPPVEDEEPTKKQESCCKPVKSQ